MMELDAELEDDLCKLWDASINEVSKFIVKFCAFLIYKGNYDSLNAYSWKNCFTDSIIPMHFKGEFNRCSIIFNAFIMLIENFGEFMKSYQFLPTNIWYCCIA